jgi:hypothetical protein
MSRHVWLMAGVGCDLRCVCLFQWKEVEAYIQAFDRGGLMGSADGNVIVLAGSCVGGGSTINWSASFAPPAYVLKDWENAGLPQFA